MTSSVIITNIDEANAITHGGVFHGDDVFATALLSYVLPEVRVARVFRFECANQDTIVYDTGMIFDPDQNRFDHHQKEFNERYENGIKLSSFGLLWRQYGNIVFSNLGLEDAQNRAAFGIVMKDLVMGIDAQDNGQFPKNEIKYFNFMTISNAISQFNPNWDNDYTADEGFIKAVEFAKIVLENAFKSAISRAKGKTIIDEAIENSSDSIMKLDCFIPWQGIVSHSDNPKADNILYVVFPNNRGVYSVQCVKKWGRIRKPFPKAWAGLEGKELEEITGVADALFCHEGQYICSAASYEGAMHLAKLAVAS